MAGTDLKKLYLDLQPRILSTSGMSELDRVLASVLGKNKSLAEAAKTQADAQIREAQRAAKAAVAASEQVERAAYRTAQAQLRYDAMVAKSGEDAARSRLLALKEAQRQEDVIRARSVEQQKAADTAVARSATARVNANNASRNAAILGTLGAVGTGLMGAGAVGLGIGAVTLRSATAWQTFVSQQQANAKMSPTEAKLFAAFALQQAVATGATPDQLLLSLRYGAERNVPLALNKRALHAAEMLGLPAGGNAALAPSMQAIVTVMRNFPNYFGQPQSAASLILAAAQHSANTTIPQFIQSIPQTLVTAGHYGNNQLPQALAAVAALTQAGMPIDEANTQVNQLYTQLATAAFKRNGQTRAVLSALLKKRGINLFPDFSSEGLREKGLLGVITDIMAAGLDPGTLKMLLPNQRGYQGLLALTGNQYGQFSSIAGQVGGAAGNGQLIANFARYMGLTTTQTSKLEQQLKVLSITLGTDLLPDFNTLLKADVVPLAKELSKLSVEYHGQITTLIELSPWLIGAGVGLKSLSLGVRGVTAAARGYTFLAKLATKIGLVESAASNAEAPIAAVIGDASAGTGLAGLGAALTALLGPLAAVLGTIGLPLAMGASTTPPSGSPVITGGRWVGKTFIPTYGNPTTSNGSYPSKMALITGALSGQAHPSQLAFGITQNHFDANRPANYTVDGSWSGGTIGHWLTASDGYTPAFHWDVGTYGQVDRAKLPGGKNAQYTVVGVRQEGPKDAFPGTWDVTFRTPGGGIFTMMHLSSLAGLGVGGDAILSKINSNPYNNIGRTFVGGQYVGPTSAAAAHLHVGGNAAAERYIYAATGGKGWSFPKGASRPKVLPQTGGGDFGLNASAIPAKVLRWTPQIMEVSQITGIPPYAIAAYMYGESSGDPNAKSAAGALGLMQVMPSTMAGLAPKIRAMGVNPNTVLGNILAGALVMESGESKYGQNWKAIYANVYNPGVSPNDPGFKNIQYGLSHFGGTYSGITPADLGFGSNSKKSGKSNPQTPYQWGENWAGRASTLSGRINAMSNFLWPGADMTNPNSQMRGFLTPFLDAYFKDEEQSELSFAKSEYGANSPLYRSAVAAIRSRYRADLKMPFWNFFGTKSAKSSTGRITPVQVVGSNHQLGVAEAHLKVAERQLTELRRQHNQDAKRLDQLAKDVHDLVKWITGHGGHVHFSGPNQSGNVVVSGPGG